MEPLDTGQQNNFWCADTREAIFLIYFFFYTNKYGLLIIHQKYSSGGGGGTYVFREHRAAFPLY